MRKLLYLPIMLLLACSQQEEAPKEIKVEEYRPEYSFKVDKLDTAQMIQGLELGKPETDKSDSGNIRTRWKIKGLDSGQVEAIGKAENAALFSGRCSEYGHDGNSIGWPADGVCHRLFHGVMANAFHNSGEAAEYALQKVGLTPFHPGDFTFRVDAQHLSLELDNDGYFFLRNSLIKK